MAKDLAKCTEPLVGFEHRYSLIKFSVRCLLTMAVLMVSSLSTFAENLIQKENQLPGSIDWQLTRVKVDGAGCRSWNIEG